MACPPAALGPASSPETAGATRWPGESGGVNLMRASLPMAPFTFLVLPSREPALPPERCLGEKGTASLFLKARPQVSWGSLYVSLKCLNCGEFGLLLSGASSFARGSWPQCLLCRRLSPSRLLLVSVPQGPLPRETGPLGTCCPPGLVWGRTEDPALGLGGLSCVLVLLSGCSSQASVLLGSWLCPPEVPLFCSISLGRM